MQRKKLAFSATLTSLPALATAQVTGGSGEITSVFEILSQTLGLDVANPYNSLAVLATLSIMSLSTYIILKQGAIKLDIADTVLPSRNGGRNLLAVMSVLITLTIFGTGAAAGLIQGFQAMFILGFTFILLGGTVFVIMGGTGGVLGGGSYMAGKTAKATTQGIKEGSEALSEASEILSTAEKEAKDGADKGNEAEEEDAASKIQDALGVINDVLIQAEGGLESKREELNDAINKVEDALKHEENEEQALGFVDLRFKRANIFLKLAADQAEDAGTGGLDLLNGEGVYYFSDEDYEGLRISRFQGLSGKGKINPKTKAPDDIYGLAGVREDMASIQGSLEAMAQPLKVEEHDLHDAFDELMDVSASAMGYHKLLKELDELLSEAERDDEMLEQLAESRRWEQLYREADHELDEEQQLEQKKEKVVGEIETLKETLENAHELLERHLKADDEMVQFLREKLEPEDDEIKQSLERLDEAVKGSDHESDYDEYIGKISNMVHDIREILEMIEDEDVSEDEAERQVIGELEEYLYSES